MDDLIARLEKATGPDRELDALIAIAAGYTIAQRCMPNAPDTYYTPKKKYIGVAPRFTESIDAALTLVPEGLCVDLRRCDDGKSGYAEIRESDTTPDGVDDELYVWSPMSPSPAIALCIAALRARLA